MTSFTSMKSTASQLTSSTFASTFSYAICAKATTSVFSLGCLVGVLTGCGGSSETTEAAQSAPAKAVAIDPAAAASFATKVGEIYKAAEAKKKTTVEGKDGVLFSPNELRFLSVGEFWGEKAKETSRAEKEEYRDPLPALVAFSTDLKAKGIHFILAPVPPKAAVNPGAIVDGASGRIDAALQTFYSELRKQGVEVLDLTDEYIQLNQREAMHLKTDTHWSPAGMEFAADKIAYAIKSQTGFQVGNTTYTAEPVTLDITGDLLPEGSTKKESITVNKVTQDGNPVTSDDTSPVLLMGDSHTLVYSQNDLLCSDAGLMQQLALRLGMPIERIGMKGSASYSVRREFISRARKEPDYLAAKKVVVYLFTAREFTESFNGWRSLALEKK